MEEMKSTRSSDRETAARIFKMGGVMILLLMLLAASFGFYFGMQSAIYDIFDHPYQNLLRSIFNLVVIAVILFIIKEYIYKK